MSNTNKSLSARLSGALLPKGRLFASRRSVTSGTREDRPNKQTQAEEQPTPSQQPRQLTQAQGQYQSPFFQLPAELRNQIYQEVFGPDICHIVSWESGLGHYCCGGIESDTWQLEGPCWGHRWFENQPAKKVEWGPYKSALLLTCRRAHAEGTPILYGSKHFIFTAPSVVLDFAKNVRSGANLAYVTFVELCAPPPYTLYVSTEAGARKDLRDWEQSVTVLKEMTGLQTLHVMIPNTKVFERWQHSKASERQLLKPLCELQAIETLIVWIAWYEGGTPGQQDKEAENYLFELKRFQGHTALSTRAH